MKRLILICLIFWPIISWASISADTLTTSSRHKSGGIFLGILFILAVLTEYGYSIVMVKNKEAEEKEKEKVGKKEIKKTSSS